MTSEKKEDKQGKLWRGEPKDLRRRRRKKRKRKKKEEEEVGEHTTQGLKDI